MTQPCLKKVENPNFYRKLKILGRGGQGFFYKKKI